MNCYFFYFYELIGCEKTLFTHSELIDERWIIFFYFDNLFFVFNLNF